MKRALLWLAAGVAAASVSDVAWAYASVGVYVGGPVYAGPPPVIYRPYPPPVIYRGPPLYAPPPVVFGPPVGYYYPYPYYGYRGGWGRPYWRGYGYGYGGYRGWQHNHRYRHR
jgi:hypothetical protein